MGDGGVCICNQIEIEIPKETNNQTKKVCIYSIREKWNRWLEKQNSQAFKGVTKCENVRFSLILKK